CAVGVVIPLVLVDRGDLGEPAIRPDPQQVPERVPAGREARGQAVLAGRGLDGEDAAVGSDGDAVNADREGAVLATRRRQVGDEPAVLAVLALPDRAGQASALVRGEALGAGTPGGRGVQRAVGREGEAPRIVDVVDDNHVLRCGLRPGAPGAGGECRTCERASAQCAY